jgi:hypothetical protein
MRLIIFTACNRLPNSFQSGSADFRSQIECGYGARIRTIQRFIIIANQDHTIGTTNQGEIRNFPMDSAVLLRFFVHAERFW